MSQRFLNKIFVAHLRLIVLILSHVLVCFQRSSAFRTLACHHRTNRLPQQHSLLQVQRNHENVQEGRQRLVPYVDKVSRPIIESDTNTAIHTKHVNSSCPKVSNHTTRHSFLKEMTSFSALPLFLGAPSLALSPEQAATDYNSYSNTYDSLDGGKAATILGIDEARSRLFWQAKGSVLEIGAGTGLNLEKYDASKITSLTLLDISDGMLQEAKKRLTSIPSLNQVPIKFIQADAASPEMIQLFGEHSFDTVVDSFSLCVMGNDGAKRCLEQIAKLVKSSNDGGKILLLENSRSSNPLLGLYQDATADMAASAGGKGCVYNQDVRNLILSTRGMMIESENAYAAGLFRSFQCAVR